MGRKQQWFKAWSYEALADDRLTSLSFAEQGVFWCIINFLRTQTDIPGYFIINGHRLTEDEIVERLKKYQKVSKGCSRHVQKWFKSVLRSGLIRNLEDGSIYSPRILEEYKESQVKRQAGLIRYYGPGHQPGHQPGHLEEKRIRSSSTNGPRSHFRVDPESVPSAPSLEEMLAEKPVSIDVAKNRSKGREK